MLFQTSLFPTGAFVSENMAQAAQEEGDSDVGEAIRLLKNLVAHGDARTLIDAGTLKVIYEILDALGLSPSDEIEAVCDLITTLAAQHAELTPDLVRGAARKVVGLMGALCGCSDLDLGLKGLCEVADLLTALCVDEESARAFQDAGAADALMRAMNTFAGSVELAKKCAACLAKVPGGGSGLDAILAKADELALACAGGDPGARRRGSFETRVEARLRDARRGSRPRSGLL